MIKNVVMRYPAPMMRIPTNIYHKLFFSLVAISSSFGFIISIYPWYTSIIKIMNVTNHNIQFITVWRLRKLSSLKIHVPTSQRLLIFHLMTSLYFPYTDSTMDFARIIIKIPMVLYTNIVILCFCISSPLLKIYLNACIIASINKTHNIIYIAIFRKGNIISV